MEMPMVRPDRKQSLSSPLMYAFRRAHSARDATKKLDLRDDAGERVVAQRRKTARVAITEPALRRELARDLEALVNTVALESTLDLQAFDAVRRSVLNFGFPDIAHRSIDEISVDNIKDELKAVLLAYEPRLVADTVKVTRDASLDTATLKVRFFIRADLICQPLNVPIEFVADVELDSAKITIKHG
jgi:type VI secretion system protein ImpF